MFKGLLYWVGKAVAVIGLIAAFIVLTFIILDGIGDKPPTTARKSQEEKISKTTERSQSMSEDPPSPPTVVEAETISPSNEPVMHGVNANSVKSDLESWGMKFIGIKKVKGKDAHKNLYIDTGRATERSTDVALSCAIITTPTLQIAGARFKANGLSVAESLPAEKYLAIAEGFLGYCAALPYDGAEPLKATIWVKENIRKVKPGKPVTTAIGSVEYQLSAGKYTRLLTMRPKK